MKGTLIAAALISVAFAVPALAADSGNPPTVPGQTFEQRQANILKILDARAAGIEEGKTCVQAATNDDELKACRKKHMAEMQEKRGEMKHHHGKKGCPQSSVTGSSPGQ